MTETLIATTTRDITFAAAGHDKIVRDFRRVPGGTEVYATERRNGTLRLRLPGTLFTQDVYASSIEPA
jgi:hypothetical protein